MSGKWGQWEMGSVGNGVSGKWGQVRVSDIPGWNSRNIIFNSILFPHHPKARKKLLTEPLKNIGNYSAHYKRLSFPRV